MARIKIDKLDYFFKKQPNLPDWIKLVTYVAMALFVLAVIYNLLFNDSEAKLNSPTKVSTVKTSNKVNLSKEKLNVEYIREDGSKQNISENLNNTLYQVISGVLSNNIPNEITDDSGSVPTYNLTQDSEIDNIYIVDCDNENCKFKLQINEYPSTKTMVRTNIYISMIKKSGIWLFSSSNNSGV